MALSSVHEIMQAQSSVLQQVVNRTNALSSYMTISNHRIDKLTAIVKNEFLARHHIESRMLTQEHEVQKDFKLITEALRVSTNFAHKMFTLQELRAGRAWPQPYQRLDYRYRRVSISSDHCHTNIATDTTRLDADHIQDHSIGVRLFQNHSSTSDSGHTIFIHANYIEENLNPLDIFSLIAFFLMSA